MPRRDRVRGAYRLMPVAGGIFWEEHGPADAPVLILSSGLGGSAGYWHPNLAALAAKHRVITYDHRGMGRSSRDVPGDLTIQAMAADLSLLIRETGVERPTLIGHAVGGMIGLAVALAEPELLGRLVVINGWARLDRHTARCFDTRLTLLRNGGARAYLHAQPLFLYPASWISEHHARLVDEEEAGVADFPGAEMIQRRIAAARRFDIVDRLRDVAVPVLLVASDDDMLVPHGCSTLMAKHLPDAQLARMASGGHACNVTRADHFNMWLLDWLDSAAE